MTPAEYSNSLLSNCRLYKNSQFYKMCLKKLPQSSKHDTETVHLLILWKLYLYVSIKLKTRLVQLMKAGEQSYYGVLLFQLHLPNNS